jgi:hypothetical protein
MHEVHLHAELGYFPVSPDIMWFRCLRPPCSAGETTICDGALLWDSLSPDVQFALRRRNLRYVALWEPKVWRKYFQVQDVGALGEKMNALEGVTYTLAEDRLYFEYVVPAVRPTKYGSRMAFSNSLLHYWLDGMRELVQFEDGRDIPEDLIRAILRAAGPITERIAWRSGDILLIDNSRMLHGREAHKDPLRKLHVKMARWAR